MWKNWGGEYLNVLDIAVYGEKNIAIPFVISNSSFYRAMENKPVKNIRANKEIFFSLLFHKICTRVNYRKKEEAIERLLPKSFDFNFEKDITLLKILEILKELK